MSKKSDAADCIDVIRDMIAAGSLRRLRASLK